VAHGLEGIETPNTSLIKNQTPLLIKNQTPLQKEFKEKVKINRSDPDWLSLHRTRTVFYFLPERCLFT
jgi:hypothetical protein